MSRPVVRIGGASGAWGDSPTAIGQLLGADVHYLMMDYLAEVTMSLLARARMKQPDAGYPPDFVGYLRPHLAELSRRGIKVVSNAGGVHPAACKRALEALCAEHGVPLAAAALQFSLRDPRVTSTIVGMSEPKRVEQTVELAEFDIPEALWDELLPIARLGRTGVLA